MGIIITLVLTILLSVIVAVIAERTFCDSLQAACSALAIVLAVFLIGCGLAIFINQITAGKEKAKFEERRKAIEWRIDQLQNDKNLLVNGGVYQDIVDYNNDLREYKFYGQSFWTNWFISKGLDEFDYIEYEGARK